MNDRFAAPTERFLRFRLPALSPAAAAAILELLDEIVVAFVDAYDAELTEDALYENELEDLEDDRTSSDDAGDDF